MKKLSILFTTAMAFLIGSPVFAGDDSSVKIKGDFRYRHEMIEKEDTKTRTRQRLRARVNIEGKVNDEAKIMVGISSGSDDPVSNNQSLSAGFSSKDVVLDIAFFEYKFKKAPGLSLLGGKVYNPFFLPGKSELVWDSDIRFEGMVAQYKREFILTSIELTGAGFWVEERGSDQNSSLVGIQGVFGHDSPSRNMKVSVGGSYYMYGNAKGFEPFFGDDAGNSLDYIEADSIYVYANEYELLELFSEVYFKVGKHPVTLMADYVKNTAADSLNDGWLFGIKAGKVKKAGSWDLKYIYRELKRDAVVGIYTDSDFIGGGTDGKGHEFGFGLGLAENTSLAATYFVNKLGFENSKDFNRLQVDAKFKF